VKVRSVIFGIVRSIRQILFSLVLIVVSALPLRVFAQQADGKDGVMDDLCGCMARIDVNGTDKAISGRVRHCMEVAVLQHPAEVRALLRHTKGEGSKAFQLGTVLGGALERDCPQFKVVRARLQQMALPQGTRQGT
jgi:hypothetical protein